jgi:general secretion pathway protein D
MEKRMVFKNGVILIMLILFTGLIYSEENKDIQLPVNLDARLKGIDKRIKPQLSKRVKGLQKNQNDDSSEENGEEESGSKQAGVRTVTPPKPKTLLDKDSSDVTEIKEDDKIKIEVKHIKPMDLNQKIKLDFQDEDLINVVKTFSELLHKNFILPDNLGKAKVNLMAPQMVTLREAYRTFLTLLAVNNFSVSEDGKFTIITREKSIPEMRIPFYKGTDVPDLFQMVATILKFDHISAQDMDNVLKIFRNKGGTSLVFDDNTLIVVDYAANIRKMRTFIQELDQPSDTDTAKLYFIKLKHIIATDARKILDDIFKDFKRTAGRTSRRGRGRAAPAQDKPQLTGVAGAPGKSPAPPNDNDSSGDSDEFSSDNLYLHIVADERSDQLILLCSQATYALVLEIVQHIDREVEGEGEIHVVKLQNAKAEDLVKTLNQLSRSGGSARGGKKATKGTDVFEGEIQISSNEATNSLVIVSSIQDYRNLRRVIEKLDIRRKQVFVEAAILEVNIDDTLEYGNAFAAAGFEVNIGGEKIPLFFGKALDSKVSPGLVAGMIGPSIEGTDGVPGLGILGGVPSLGMILNAAHNDSAVNVMSTPHLLTTDNEEAEIIVGETIPFQSGNIISGTAGSTLTYTREDVALKLKIKPQINESGYMTLDINQEITELGAQTAFGFTTTKRQAKTIINAENEQTIVIGGLMKDSITESENKVPLLGDIPVLGALFKYKRTVKKKVNLLIIITPHIIESKDDFARILKRKVEERDEFAKRYYGDYKSFEGSVYLEKKRGALLSIVKTVNEINEKESEEILRLEAQNKAPKTIMVTPDGGTSDVNEENNYLESETEDIFEEFVPGLEGE